MKTLEKHAIASEKHLGPLEQLIGTWKGDKGIDVFAPPFGDPVITKYKETITFERIPPTENPPFQTVYGLRYLIEINNLETEKPMHQETGYWLLNKSLFGGFTIIRAFSVPHGISIMAGGHINSKDTKEWTVKAESGHPKFGILNNPYLDVMAKTTAFTSKYTITPDNALVYSEVSTLDFIAIKKEHTDQNRLIKIM